MSKTDKILYDGFAVVALANLVVMLVSVFSPQSKQATSNPVIANDPKQKKKMKTNCGKAEKIGKNGFRSTPPSIQRLPSTPMHSLQTRK